MKRYYSYSVAFRCTEKEFQSSKVDGVLIIDALKSIDYNVSELSFSEGREYLANYSRGKSGYISAVPKPDASHVYVFEKWDAEIFFAFCCQTSAPKVVIGEYYIDSVKRLHRAKSIHGEYVDSFKRKDISKAGLLHLMEIHRERTGGDSLGIENFSLASEVKESLKTEGYKSNLNRSFAMSREEILSAMIEKKTVFYGSLWREEGHVYSCPACVLGMTKDKVIIDSEADNDCAYGDLFESTAHFARYILHESE